jgi:hypothetical protein
MLLNKIYFNHLNDISNYLLQGNKFNFGSYFCAKYLIYLYNSANNQKYLAINQRNNRLSFTKIGSKPRKIGFVAFEINENLHVSKITEFSVDCDINYNSNNANKQLNNFEKNKLRQLLLCHVETESKKHKCNKIIKPEFTKNNNNTYLLEQFGFVPTSYKYDKFVWLEKHLND